MIPVTIRQREPLLGVSELPDQSIQCCIARLPLWTGKGERNTGYYGEEHAPEEYLEKIVRLFNEIWRVVRDEGSLWLIVGDSYWGREVVERADSYPLIRQHLDYKSNDLVGFPWQVAFALRQQGWILRQDLIWHKSNPIPESVTDRCTRAHEYIFHFSKKESYYHDQEVLQIEELPAYSLGKRAQERRLLTLTESIFQRRPHKRNRASVWSARLHHLEENHFHVIPDSIVKDCITATTQPHQLVLDPFLRIGNTALIARQLQRGFIGFEMNATHIAMAQQLLDDNQQTTAP